MQEVAPAPGRGPRRRGAVARARRPPTTTSTSGARAARLALAKRVRGLRPGDHPVPPRRLLPASRPPSAERARRHRRPRLAVCRRARHVEVRVHELDYDAGPARVDARRPGGRGACGGRRTGCASTPRPSGTAWLEAFGLRPDRVDAAPTTATTSTRRTHARPGRRRAAARPAGRTTSCSSRIGFVQPHKGFDRAIDAFAALGAGWPADPPRRRRLGPGRGARLRRPRSTTSRRRVAPGPRRPPPRRATSATSGSTAGSSPPTSSCCPTGTSGRRACSSGPPLYGRPVIATRVGGLGRPGRRPAPSWSTTTPSWPARWPGRPGSGWTRWPRRRAGPVAGPGRSGRGDGRDPRPGRGGRRWPRSPSPPGRPPLDRPDRAASARLRRVPPLAAPSPASASGRAAAVKKLVWRLTGWELGPVIHQINKLHEALIDTVEAEAAAKAPGGAERTTQVTPGAVEGLGDAGARQPD